MTAEKFFWAWLKSEIIIPKKLGFKATNYYYELLKNTIEKGELNENIKSPI